MFAGKVGLLFVNADETELLPLVPEKCTIHTYGSDPESPGLDTIIEIIKTSPSIEYNFSESQNRYTGSSSLMGNYNFQNVKTAVTLGLYFKVPPEKITIAIEAYVSQNNRSQLVKTDKNQITLDAYNANPTSVLASVRSFMKINSGLEKYVILGDMLELGSYSNTEHQDVYDKVHTLKPDFIILVGREFMEVNTGKDTLKMASTEELLQHLFTT